VAIEIRELAECSEVAANIAEWHWPEWEPGSPDGTIDGLRRMLASWTAPHGVPCIFVAFQGDEPVGSVALVSHDMEQPEQRFVGLTPWLSGLFVIPDARRQGAGAALVTACQRRAELLGFANLYLYTQTAEGFYERLDWATFAEADYEDDVVKVMRTSLDSN
jgi:GNAT superfamily N-acetyltransferase